MGRTVVVVERKRVDPPAVEHLCERKCECESVRVSAYVRAFVCVYLRT